MKYCFIINPRAGKGTFVDQLCQEISLVCGHAGVEYDIFTSKTIGDTRGYIKETVASADDRVTFFSCGGDGTLCETILSVMSLDSEMRKKACVGIVPKGTGNDFVSNFDKKELFCNIAEQIEGTTHDIDILKCNNLYSVNMINIGFDCHVVCKKEEIGKKKWIPRKLAYIFATVLTLGKRPTISLKRVFDGKKAGKKELLLTTYANGAFCGGGFRSNPNARINSGEINGMFVKNISRTTFLGLVGSYKAGTHLNEKTASIIFERNARTFEVAFDSPTQISVDGEIVTVEGMKLECIPEAMSFLVPKGAVYVSEKARQEATV